MPKWMCIPYTTLRNRQDLRCIYETILRRLHNLSAQNPVRVYEHLVKAFQGIPVKGSEISLGNKPIISRINVRSLY